MSSRMWLKLVPLPPKICAGTKRGDEGARCGKTEIISIQHKLSNGENQDGQPRTDSCSSNAQATGNVVPICNDPIHQSDDGDNRKVAEPPSYGAAQSVDIEIVYATQNGFAQIWCHGRAKWSRFLNHLMGVISLRAMRLRPNACRPHQCDPARVG